MSIDPAEAARIAKGLTKAQREWVLATYERQGKSAMTALEMLGISRWGFLTRLGLAVAEALKAEGRS